MNLDANTLSESQSAYLRAHAQNPIHWHSYSKDLIAQAQAMDKPLFISIGYSACHWCHVMAEESFTDPQVAQVLNANFVCIKVDREEHPQLDAYYLRATTAMTGTGGWPMTIFATPSGQPFYAATYLPPVARHGLPSLTSVVTSVIEAWHERRVEVIRSAEGLEQQLERQAEQLRTIVVPEASAARAGPTAFGQPSEPGQEGPGESALNEHLADVLKRSIARLKSEVDAIYGGFGTDAKFPHAPVLRFAVEAKERALLGATLDPMLNSATYDLLGGGFFRYSVTRDWATPHFEKMLVDNAQLISVLAMAPGYEKWAAHSVRWMLASLRLDNGAFASSLNADTVIGAPDSPDSALAERHEGATYLWSADQVREALAGEAEIENAQVQHFIEMFGLGEEPQVLHLGRELDAADRELIDRVRPVLLGVRSTREQPARDEKIVLGWNALAVIALVDIWRMYLRLGEPERAEAMLNAALKTMRYLERVHPDNRRGKPGQWMRVSYAQGDGGEALADVPATDFDRYAFALAAFRLAGATGLAKWASLGETILTVSSGEALSPEDVLEDAEPASVALHALAWNWFSHLAPLRAIELEAEHGFGLDKLYELSGLAPNAPLTQGGLLEAIQLATRAHATTVVTPGSRAESLIQAAAGYPDVSWLVRVSAESEEAARPTRDGPDSSTPDGSDEHPGHAPLLVEVAQDKPPSSDGGAQAYLCVGYLCQAPVGSAAALAQDLCRRREADEVHRVTAPAATSGSSPGQPDQ